MIPIGAWAAGCGPLRLLRSRKFIIQYSKFRITKSGCSLRRTRTKRTFGDANCGPPPGEAAARRCLRHRIRLKRAHSRTDGLATLEEQPSAGGGGCGLQRFLSGTANSEFKIQDSKLDGLPDMLGHTFLFGPQAAARSAFARSISTRGQPAAELQEKRVHKDNTFYEKSKKNRPFFSSRRIAPNCADLEPARRQRGSRCRMWISAARRRRGRFLSS